jgi:hypothetical protein
MAQRIGGQPRGVLDVHMRGGWPERAAVAGLLAVMALQLVHGLRSDGLTNDEVIYIASGWRQLALGDHRLNPTHPPLASDLVALGLLGLRPRTPAFEHGADPLAYSYRFVHVENDARAMIVRARTPVVLLALALALLCWAWAREVGGRAAGLMALALVAFHPTLLAHGHLATTDLAAAFAMLAAAWCFWRWWRRPRAPWALATAVALGAAVGTRLTAWILAPCLAAMVLMRLFRAPAAARPRVAREALVLAALLMAVVPLTIWAAYGFQAAPDHLLPAPYVEGVRFQALHNRRGHLAYLLGETSRRGWPHYFAAAFAVKSTPGFLAALVLAALGWRRGSQGKGDAALLWLLPAALTLVAVSAGRIQIGERYLLPVHAFLILLMAAGLARWTRGRWRSRAGLAAGGAILLHAVSGLAAGRGGHLAYFNVLAGGTRGGHRVLLDSNLDWGQDLPRLAEWMRVRGVPSVQLAYMGADDPGRFGIAREDLPGRSLHDPRPARRPLTGTVVVSPNLLFGLVPPVAAHYAPLRERPPDDRAGVFFVYHLDRPGP